MKTIILYLIGYPGVGKYTIAKEITKTTSYIVCDNQLINNPIYSLLEYDGFKEIPKFAEDIIDKIRENIFEFLSIEKERSYILTNFLGEDMEHALYKRVMKMAQERSSIFIPVRFSITKEEHIWRITDENRLMRFKSIDIKYTFLGDILIKINHPYLLNLDVTNLSAEQAATVVIAHIQKCIFVKSEDIL